MVSDRDRKIVNFLDEFEQEQQEIQQRYEEFGGDENALRRRSEDPDSFEECKPPPPILKVFMLIHPFFHSFIHSFPHPST